MMMLFDGKEGHARATEGIFEHACQFYRYLIGLLVLGIGLTG